MNAEKMVRKKTILKKFIIPAMIIIGILIFLYYQNNMITTTNITIQSQRVPKSFDSYKIVHLSDLHGKSFDKNQSNLVKEIKKAQPDLIVFTGDLVDSRRYKEEHSLELMKQVERIAPVYYVTGNHEWRSGRFYMLERALIDCSIKVLHNTFDKIKKGEDEIYIIGIDDPSSDYQINKEKEITKDRIEASMEGLSKEDGFKILLSHRPEMFSLYSQHDIDVIFSGHAHGGQIRLPFIGGLVAPHQGLFPKYTSGKHTQNSSAMIVSRGLGNSIFPQRLFNRPEIVVVELKRDDVY